MLLRLFGFANFIKTVDEPEGAHGERGRRFSKIVLVGVPVQQAIITKVFFNGTDGAFVFGVLGINKSVGFH